MKRNIARFLYWFIARIEYVVLAILILSISSFIAHVANMGILFNLIVAAFVFAAYYVVRHIEIVFDAIDAFAGALDNLFRCVVRPIQSIVDWVEKNK